jgi:hypothetical protein
MGIYPVPVFLSGLWTAVEVQGVEMNFFKSLSERMRRFLMEKVGLGPDSGG